MEINEGRQVVDMALALLLDFLLRDFDLFVSYVALCDREYWQRGDAGLSNSRFSEHRDYLSYRVKDFLPSVLQPFEMQEVAAEVERIVPNY